MCHDAQGNSIKELNGAKRYRLADYFDQWWDIYKAHPKTFITEEQYKAVNAIRTCRTAALGIDVYACPDCGDTHEVYHSCRNRFCPTCSWQDTVKWAERINGQMLNIPHRHVVMTVPHGLNRLIKENNKHILNILLRTAADTIKDWLLAKYGIVPGIISVLHTFGETKDYHVHVHMIVSWGGIHKQTGRLEEIKGEYVKYDFLKAKFRNKFEDNLVALYHEGQLYHRFQDRLDFMRFIKSINKSKWIVHLEPPMENPLKVVRYIGRYSKRACLSEYKITKMAGEKIAFRYKDYKTQGVDGSPVEREMELDFNEFFPRLLQHVPLKYFRLVRYYGFYSNKGVIPESYLNQAKEEEESIAETVEDKSICTHCQKPKEYMFTVVKNRLTGYENIYIRPLLARKNRLKTEAA